MAAAQASLALFTRVLPLLPPMIGTIGAISNFTKSSAAAGAANAVTNQAGSGSNQGGAVFDQARKVAETLIKHSILPAMNQQFLQETFVARVGDEQLGVNLFEHFKEEAIRAGNDVETYLRGTIGNLSVAENVGQLEKLNQFAQQLDVFTGGGLEAAFSAVSQAAEGNVSELTSLGIPQEAIEQFNLEGLAQKGDMDGFLQAFDQMLESLNMGKEEFDQLMQTPLQKVNALKNNFQQALADSGQGAVQALAPAIDLLYQAFQSGQFQPFFDVLYIGLTLVAQGLTFVIQLALELWNAFMTVFPYLSPIIMGVSAGLFLVTAAQRLFNISLLQNPIGLIIVLIAGLIVGLLTLLAVFQPVREVVANALRSMGQAFAGFVGFVVDLLEGFLNFFISIFNAVLSGVNKVVNALGSLLGIEAGIDFQLEKVDFSGFKNQIQNGITGALDTAANATENFSLENIKASFGLDKQKQNPVAPDVRLPSANQWKAGPQGEIPAVGGAETMNQWNAGAQMQMAIPRIEEVGTVGSIGETVDISSEDLRIMRDLAETKALQNFVTLTPTVQVQTGDIRQEADIDTLVQRIGTYMEQEIAISAEGVYGW